MSGHSKWSTIKRQKGLADNRRSAIFTKLARQISVAAREGGDPEANFKLRLAIDRARNANLPNHNIERAIQSGTGELRGDQLKSVTYEGFGPGQVAIIVQGLTDNPNRTSAEIRNLFTRHNGALGSINSVAWMFTYTGAIRLPVAGLEPGRETIELGLIDAGAEDVKLMGDELMIQTDPTKLMAVRNWLVTQDLQPTSADLEFLPHTSITIDASTRDKLYTLLAALDEHDDITAIFNNEA